MFAPSAWSYNPDPDEFGFEKASEQAARVAGADDLAPLDGLPNYIDDDNGEGDLDLEREQDLLLLKAYTGQLDEELKQSGVQGDTKSPQITSNFPTTPKTSMTNAVAGVRSAPGEILIRTKKSQARISNRTHSDDENDANSSNSTNDEESDERGLDDLKLGRRRVSPFASASKRRKILNDTRPETDLYVVDSSSNSSDADNDEPKNRRPSSVDDNDDDVAAKTLQRDILLDFTDALHAIHGHAPLPEISAADRPQDHAESDFFGPGTSKLQLKKVKPSAGRKRALDDGGSGAENDDADDDGLSLPTVVDSRRSHGGGGGANSNRYFDEEFGNSACFRCGQMGHQAADCENHQRMCFLCGAPEHTQERRCPNTLCYNCFMPGHSSRDCRNPKAPKGACNRCGRSGHKPWSCANANRTNKYCYNCGGRGHSGMRCDLPAIDEFARMRDRLKEVRDMATYSRRKSLDMEYDYERRQRRDRETQAYRDRVSGGGGGGGSSSSSSKHTFFENDEENYSRGSGYESRRDSSSSSRHQSSSHASAPNSSSARGNQKQQQQQQKGKSNGSNPFGGSNRDDYQPSSGDEQESDFADFEQAHSSDLDSFGLDDFSGADDDDENGDVQKGAAGGSGGGNNARRKQKKQRKDKHPQGKKNNNGNRGKKRKQPGGAPVGPSPSSSSGGSKSKQRNRPHGAGNSNNKGGPKSFGPPKRR